MSRILCTGGAGYIGSILVRDLLHAGHLVTIVDNFMYNQTPFLDICYSSNLEIIRKDIANLEPKFFDEFEIIIPLACLTGAPLCKYDPLTAKAVIVDSLKYMLECISSNTKVIYPNTNSGYGTGEASKFCTEETPVNPISLYGQLKCEAENMVMNRENSVGFRLATVFGAAPRMRLDLLVNDFVYRAVNDKFVVLFEPHFKRNYIHVKDVSKAFLHAINNWDQMKGEIYNVGLSSANLSKMELCQKIKEQIKDFVYLEAPIGEDPDKRDYIVSNEKLEKTGWKPFMTLEDGIQELIKAYQVIKRNQYANI